METDRSRNLRVRTETRDERNQYVRTYTETRNKRSQRARTAYLQLHRLQDMGVELTRRYTVYDDPEEMELEYRIHKERHERRINENKREHMIVNICLGLGYLYDRFMDWDRNQAHGSSSHTSLSNSDGPLLQ